MKHSKSGLFLMEMIVCILFFSLSAAVSAQMFAKSHIISQTAINENHAVIEVNNLAEAFYAENGNIAGISEILYPGLSLTTPESITVYFDAGFNAVSFDGEAAAYYVELKTGDLNDNHTKDGTVSFYDMSDTSKPIYSLDVTVNVPRTAKESN
ncbi:MAG: hypothetical protein IKN35_01265 [Lachnospiraceae bacterium]|nr:hypothetical protein [Lachnospiraceae bacterium]MBR6908908.1 hypothetical protein [Lachnospiraceae bacterium]